MVYIPGSLERLRRFKAGVLTLHICHAVARKQLAMEVTQYRSLSQLKDQLAVASAPSPAVES